MQQCNNFKYNFLSVNKRLFIAIKYKPNNIISDLIKDLKIDLENEKIKWVDTDNMHLTLKFYGDTDTEKIPGLIEHLHEVAEKNEVLNLSVKELGAFYRGKFPSVLFLNLSENEQLMRLAEAISKTSELYGFTEDKRKFKSHITLARIKYINNLHLFNDLIKTKVKQSFTVESFFLYESELTPKGAVYSVVEEFRL